MDPPYLEPQLKIVRVPDVLLRNKLTAIAGVRDGNIFCDMFAYPIGVKVSNPLTADHGKPAFFTTSCRLRAVMSIARANGKWSVVS